MARQRRARGRGQTQGNLVCAHPYEYGGMDGITTLEDIIESLLGFEIVDEKDRVEDMQQFAIKRWQEKQKKYELLKSNK
jgi:Mg2+/Co2+ transporter CorB